jgi:hypothetical protein
MVHSSALDEPGACPRSRDHNEYLAERFNTTAMWKRWEIIGDVTDVEVCSVTSTLISTTNNLLPAIYREVPLCQYPRVTVSRSSPSSHQRCLQRSPCRLGRGYFYTLPKRRHKFLQSWTILIVGEWQVVILFTFFSYHLGLLVRPVFLVYVGSKRAGILSNGLGTILKLS